MQKLHLIWKQPSYWHSIAFSFTLVIRFDKHQVHLILHCQESSISVFLLMATHSWLKTVLGPTVGEAGDWSVGGSSASLSTIPLNIFHALFQFSLARTLSPLFSNFADVRGCCCDWRALRQNHGGREGKELFSFSTPPFYLPAIDRTHLRILFSGHYGHLCSTDLLLADFHCVAIILSPLWHKLHNDTWLVKSLAHLLSGWCSWVQFLPNWISLWDEIWKEFYYVYSFCYVYYLYCISHFNLKFTLMVSNNMSSKWSVINQIINH